MTIADRPSAAMNDRDVAFGVERPLAMTAAERCARNRQKMRQARREARKLATAEAWAARDPDVRRCRKEAKQSAKRVARVHARLMADALAALERADELQHARLRRGRPKKGSVA